MLSPKRRRLQQLSGSWTASELSIQYKPGFKCQNPIHSSQLAYEFLLSIWDKERINLQEQYMAVFLHVTGKTIGYRLICTGNMVSTPIDVRLIISLALHTLAASVILAHNHPSEVLKPSNNDITTTMKIKDALALIDVKLLDHLIISESDYLSMADKRLI